MNTPKLRFPEFKEEWEKKKFGDEINESGYGPRFSGEDYSFNGNVKTIRGTDISLDGEILYDQVPLAYLNEEFIKNHILEDGDLIMITTADCGLTGVFRKQEIHYIPSAYAVKLRLKKSANSEYFKYLLQTTIAYNQVNKFTRKATIGNLPGSDILKFEFKIPTLPEQTKIANFLSAVDTKLQALKKKKSLLEQYKKGVMQQLFSQELRFKDENGRDFPDWEVKKLGELGETYSGLSGKSKENFGIGKPYIQYKQIFDDNKIDISRFEFVDISDNENQNKVQFGDVFFTVSSETPNEIGMSSVLLDEIEELYLNSFCFGYRANSLKELSPYFSKFLFRSEIFRTEIIKLAQGSTRYNMSKVQLLKIEINLPSFPEQTTIANFLTAIDDKINKTNSQINQTELWKKGLLQGMFV